MFRYSKLHSIFPKTLLGFLLYGFGITVTAGLIFYQAAWERLTLNIENEFDNEQNTIEKIAWNDLLNQASDSLQLLAHSPPLKDFLERSQKTDQSAKKTLDPFFRKFLGIHSRRFQSLQLLSSSGSTHIWISEETQTQEKFDADPQDEKPLIRLRERLQKLENPEVHFEALPPSKNGPPLFFAGLSLGSIRPGTPPDLLFLKCRIAPIYRYASMIEVESILSGSLLDQNGNTIELRGTSQKPTWITENRKIPDNTTNWIIHPIPLRFPDSEKPFLNIILAVSPRIIRSMQQGIIRQSIFLSLATFLFAIFLSFILSRKISQPVQALTRQIEQVATGDYSVRAPEGRQDELGQLAESFNAMIRSLKASTESREQSEKRFRGLAENAADAFLLCNLENLHIQDVNRVTCIWLGYERVDFSNLKMDDILKDVHSDKFSAIRKSARIGNTYSLESSLKRKDDSFFPASSRITILESDGQRLALFLIRDDTEHRRIIVDLQQAKNEAELANQTKTDFLATMSHELRTPLHSILGMSAFLEETTKNPSNRNRLTAIGQSGRRLLRLVNDLLDFTKIEAGAIQITPRSFNLHLALENVISTHFEQAQSRGLDLQLDIQNSLPEIVLGDRLRILQVLSNLVDNAIKYTESGQVCLSVQSLLKEDICECQLAVSDTGPGIPLDRQVKIFERFQQIDPARTNPERGVGLGLAICQQLAELMGTSIKLESKVGQGSTFQMTLDLPLPTPEEKQRNRDTTQITRRGSSRVLFKKRILFVEDDPFGREIGQGMLQRLGCKVTLAKDGQEALQLMEQETFDLILMDCQMPVMTGWTATQLYREREEHSERTPIVAVSADALDSARERSLAAGMDDYITKPFRIEDLEACLEAWTTSDSANRSPSDSIPRPSNKTSTKEFLDWSMIDSIQSFSDHSSESSFQSLCKLLEDSTIRDMEDLKCALEAEDDVRARQLAHTLKGRWSTLGARPFIQDIESLQAHLRARDFPLSSECFSRLQSVWPRIREELHKKK